MDPVAELFAPPATEAVPPEAQRWAHFLQAGIVPRCTFVRRRDGLSWGPARIVVSYPGAQPPVPPDPAIAWDAELDRWLVAHHVRAVDENNEAERFGFGLQARFESIERRCGSGYFNALLVHYLLESGLSEQSPIAEKLRAIHEYRPELTPAMSEYATQIERVFRSAAQDLGGLEWGREQAIEILLKAIAYYLDDRFNVSMRRLLNLG